MKKTLLSLSLILSVNLLFAQSFNLGIRAGLNESALDYKQPQGNNTSRLTGFNAGVFAELGIGNISLQPGFFYTTKGQNNSFNNSSTNTDGNTTVSGTGRGIYNYLELPLNILYNIPTHIGKFFIGGGPYAAIALSGNSKLTTTYTPEETNTPTTTTRDYKLTFGNTVNDIKRQDYGLGALAGFRLKNGVQVSAGYEHGLTTLSNGSNYHEKHDVLSFSIGYAFL